MKLFLILLCLGFSFNSWSVGRSPAVEDFIGIDPKQSQAGKALTPSGTEVLFNFSEGVPHQNSSPVVQKSTPSQAPIGALLGLVFLLALPMVSWFLIMRHLNKEEAAFQDHHETHNVASLADYREENKEELKKAS